MPKVKALDHLVLTVSDIETSLEFYGRLGMTHQEFAGADGALRHALTFGCQKINLHAKDHPISPHARTPMPGAADLCLISYEPLSSWVTHLSAVGLGIELGPVDRTGATGPLRSIHVRDPDGNLIEIAEQV